MLSDAILAYDKFVLEVSHAHLVIMVLYLVAQYLIVIGAVERKLLHNT